MDETSVGTVRPIPDAVLALDVQDLYAGYYADQPVLRGLTLSCRSGQVTALLGPNGAGKSTALRAFCGLLRPSAGHVLLFGEDVTGMAAHDLISHGVAFLPQGRSTFPELTVEENLQLGGWTLRNDKGAMTAALERAYARYPILAETRRSPAGRLSGGQQRILEISRALVPDPRVVLIDEPSVGLSPILADQSYRELGLLKEEGRTIVIVDQNVRAAVQLADYIYGLRDGRTYREGPAAVVGSDLAGLVKEWLGV